jgi:polyphosphate kinase
MKSSSRNPDGNPKTARGASGGEVFINRELSWLGFNERVLEEAEREDLPLLERAKFLAITASNLDEFFMVRVGALQVMRERQQRSRDAAGLTPHQQWTAIEERASAFMSRQYTLLNERLLPALRNSGVRRLGLDELTPQQRTDLEDHFMEFIHPVLSPVALDLDATGVLTIPALQITLLCQVEGEAEGGGDFEKRLVVITLPAVLARHITVADAEGRHCYVNLEDLVQMCLHHLFPAERVLGVARFRVSRNSDITVDDEGAADLAMEMEQVLEARLVSPAIRLEIEAGAPRSLVSAVKRICGARVAQVFEVPGELDLRAYFAIAGLAGFDHLRVEGWQPSPSADMEPGGSIFEAISRGDLLLHHPFESFEPVLQLVEEAAADPDTVAVKMILYRTAKNSRIISALIRAAEAGKHVTVLVELKARFDEARNLERAEELQRAGAQIIYGVRGLKTHSKICLVMRREGGRMKRYMHFGTGNYNEATARLYTDISYLTCRAGFGADASAFFNTVTGRSRFVHFEKISMAPFGLRERLLRLIDSEAERARQGEDAEIILKMNSLEDRKMIEALYSASKAGVRVRINVRGICCLRPGVKGLSENIRVVSVIDRYLEHARIYAFRQGGRWQVFISSADFMRRNLSSRVELLVPVEDSRARKRLLSVLETCLADNQQARQILADGSHAPVRCAPGAKALRSQEVFSREAQKRARSAQQSPDVLVPHRPGGTNAG